MWYVDPLDVQFWWIPARPKLHQINPKTETATAWSSYKFGYVMLRTRWCGKHHICIRIDMFTCTLYPWFSIEKKIKRLCALFSLLFRLLWVCRLAARYSRKKRLDWLGRDLRRLSYRKSKEILSILWTIATGGHVACVSVWHACLPGHQKINIETCRTLGHLRTP